MSRKVCVYLGPEAVRRLRDAWEAGADVSALAISFEVAEITICKRAVRGSWDAAKRDAACRRLRTGRYRRHSPRSVRAIAGGVRRLFESGAPMVDVLASAQLSDSGLRSRALRENWDCLARRRAIEARQNPELRRCSDCGHRRPTSEFYVRIDYRRGRNAPRPDGRCKECSRLRARARDWKAFDGGMSMDEVRALFAASKTCIYCTRLLSSREKTLDHIIPLARGGTHERENVAIACAHCNTSKGTRTPLEWLVGRVA